MDRSTGPQTNFFLTWKWIIVLTSQRDGGGETWQVGNGKGRRSSTVKNEFFLKYNYSKTITNPRNLQRWGHLDHHVCSWSSQHNQTSKRGQGDKTIAFSFVLSKDLIAWVWWTTLPNMEHSRNICGSSFSRLQRMHLVVPTHLLPSFSQPLNDFQLLGRDKGN